MTKSIKTLGKTHKLCANTLHLRRKEMSAMLSGIPVRYHALAAGKENISRHAVNKQNVDTLQRLCWATRT